MIETLKKYKTLLIVVVIVIVAFVGYSMFFDVSNNSGTVLVSKDTSAQKGGDNKLLVLLVNLKSITLDESLFSDSAFRSLIDFGQQLVPEPTGRQNPFAPVGSESI